MELASPWINQTLHGTRESSQGVDPPVVVSNNNVNRESRKVVLSPLAFMLATPCPLSWNAFAFELGSKSGCEICFREYTIDGFVSIQSVFMQEGASGKFATKDKCSRDSALPFHISRVVRHAVKQDVVLVVFRVRKNVRVSLWEVVVDNVNCGSIEVRSKLFPSLKENMSVKRDLLWRKCPGLARIFGRKNGENLVAAFDAGRDISSIGWHSYLSAPAACKRTFGQCCSLQRARPSKTSQAASSVSHVSSPAPAAKRRKASSVSIEFPDFSLAYHEVHPISWTEDFCSLFSPEVEEFVYEEHSDNTLPPRNDRED